MHISKAVFAFTLYVASVQVLAAPVNPDDGLASHDLQAGDDMTPYDLVARDEVVPLDLGAEDESTSDDHDEASPDIEARDEVTTDDIDDEEAPTHGLEARAGPPGTSARNPIKAPMKANKENSLPFDADCYAILCLGVKPVFQRDRSESYNNRKDAGARKKFGTKNGPFRAPKEAKVQVPPGNQYVSPEEFPFASTRQGGHGATLYPVSEASQRSQGGAINQFYSKNRIASGRARGARSWFQIDHWVDAEGPYFKALNKHQGKPNKKDPICQKGNKANGPWGFDVADYAYHYNGKVYQKAGKNK